MKAHAVPQEIMSMEFKLFGNFLSLREFLFIAGGVATAYFFYFLSRQGLMPGILAWPAALMFGLGGVMMGLVPIQDRSLDTWIINYFQAIRRPTQRVWKKPGFNPVNTDMPGNSGTSSTVSVKDHVVAPPQSEKKNVVGTSDTPVEAATKSALNEDDQKRIDDEELERLREIERSLQDAVDKQKGQTKQIKDETTDSNTTRQETAKASKGNKSNSQSASNSQKTQSNKSQKKTSSNDDLQKMPSYDINKDNKSKKESNSKKNSKSKMDNQNINQNNQNQNSNPPNQQTPTDPKAPSYDIQSPQNQANQQTDNQGQSSGHTEASNQSPQPQQSQTQEQPTSNPSTPPANEANNTATPSASQLSSGNNQQQPSQQQDQPAQTAQNEDQSQFRAPGPSADINAANTSPNQQQPSGSALQQPIQQQTQQPTQQPVPQPQQQTAQNQQGQTNAGSGFITISDDNIDQFKTEIPGIEPNVNNINIVIKDREGQYIPKVTCIVKDQQESPVRAALSNQLGQIVNNVPLKDGSYKVQLSKQGYVFPVVTRVLTGKKYPAIEIRSL